MPERHAGDAFSMSKAATTTERESVSIVQYWLRNAWKPLFYVHEQVAVVLHNMNPWNPWFSLPDHLDE